MKSFVHLKKKNKKNYMMPKSPVETQYQFKFNPIFYQIFFLEPERHQRRPNLVFQSICHREYESVKCISGLKAGC